MAVLINFKICDNAKECDGIAVCKTGALYWDKEKKCIGIDNSKCISCGACEKVCGVNAIHVAKTDEEYEKIKKEIDNDPRKISDLFVDRYGAMPIDEYGFSIEEKDFQGRILGATKKFAVVEIWNASSIRCLNSSIPIKELISRDDTIYRKMEIKDQDFFEKYNIRKLPVLLFFSEGKWIGKIEGFYNKEQKEELKRKIKEIIG